MALIYEKNISKIHDEYTLRVTEMLQGYIYESMLYVFEQSQTMYDQLLTIRNNKKDDGKKKPPMLGRDVVFQNY